jgi:hypothetical protein
MTDEMKFKLSKSKTPGKFGQGFFQLYPAAIPYSAESWLLFPFLAVGIAGGSCRPVRKNTSHPNLLGQHINKEGSSPWRSSSKKRLFGKLRLMLDSVKNILQLKRLG